MQKKNSGTVLQTQIESLPYITVQVWLPKYDNNGRNQVTDHKNIYVQILVFRCYICKNPNWHKNGRETQDQEESANIYKCNMLNNTIKITLYCIPKRKVAKVASLVLFITYWRNQVQMGWDVMETQWEKRSYWITLYLELQKMHYWTKQNVKPKRTAQSVFS